MLATHKKPKCMIKKIYKKYIYILSSVKYGDTQFKSGPNTSSYIKEKSSHLRSNAKIFQNIYLIFRTNKNVIKKITFIFKTNPVVLKSLFSSFFSSNSSTFFLHFFTYLCIGDIIFTAQNILSTLLHYNYPQIWNNTLI